MSKIDEDVLIVEEDEEIVEPIINSPDNSDWIHVDEVGTCDDEDVMIEEIVRHSEKARGLSNGSRIQDCISISDSHHFSEDSIALSSDEEEDPGDREVVLERLVRPAPISFPEVPVECLDILDSDEEFPVCLAEEEKNDVNVEEKYGYIQEYIEIEGAGIIFSREFGLVLFHLENIWINGVQFPCAETRDRLPAGSHIKFYDKSFEGPEYSVLSQECVFHQAIVVWMGARPQHLMKKLSNLGPEYRNHLDMERKSFLLYLRGEVFIRAALVKVKGQVKGYLNPEIGIIEVSDQNNVKKNAFFHVNDVRIYRKPMLQYNGRHGQLLPAGLNVSVDAREIYIAGVENLQYQALLVLAGPWPQVPKPTLLPGGDGSFSPCYESPKEKHTFYYLELQMESRLSRQMNYLKDVLGQTQGVLEYDWRGVTCISTPEDRTYWREQFEPNSAHATRRQERRPWEKKAVDSVFKAPRIKRFKTKRELDGDTASIDATAGSCPRSPGQVSSISTMSRPHSSFSDHSEDNKHFVRSRIRALNSRNWFSGSCPGALTIKSEVKQELDEYGEPSWRSKKVKSETDI